MGEELPERFDECTWCGHYFVDHRWIEGCRGWHGVGPLTADCDCTVFGRPLVTSPPMQDATSNQPGSEPCSEGGPAGP